MIRQARRDHFRELWLALLGLPGLLVFKAVSTADSMIGHLTARHAAFGWAAARADYALNLLPARLSPLRIYLRSVFCTFTQGLILLHKHT